METIKKALADCKDMMESEKLQGFTQFEVNSIWFILQYLNRGYVSATSTEKIAKWFAKHGFFVTQDSFGWIIGVSSNTKRWN